MARGEAIYARFAGFVSSWLGMLLLFGWSAALFYHLLNGVRHLCWDAGDGYDLPTLQSSAYAVLVGTAVLTALAWIAGLALAA